MENENYSIENVKETTDVVFSRPIANVENVSWKISGTLNRKLLKLYLCYQKNYSVIYHS